SMIRYSHAMTCLMAYYNKKGIETISIVLQTLETLICHNQNKTMTNRILNRLRTSGCLQRSTDIIKAMAIWQEKAETAKFRSCYHTKHHYHKSGFTSSLSLHTLS
ncbi:MAG: hypothetical protein WA364_26805, partial [Candidatus Nitrosopolaris sp.]